MAITATQDFKTTFNLGGTPNFIIQDITPYSDEGISLSAAHDFLKITAPDGTVLIDTPTSGTPDISPSVSTTNTAVHLPLDAYGNVISGTYTVVMTTVVTGMTQPGTYIKTKSFSYTFAAPVVAINQTVDILNAQFVSTDSTSYSYGSTTPTITRTHNVFYIDNANAEQTVTTSGAQLTINYPNLFSGVYSTTISTVLSYDFGSGWLTTVIVTGSKQINVQPDRNMCSLYCGLKNLNTRYTTALYYNPELAAAIGKQLQQITYLWLLFGQALACGKQDDANAYMAQIQSVGQFTSDCDCDGDSPTQILPIGGGGGGTYSFVEGAGITIATVVVGSNTTVTIALDPSDKAKLDASYNTVVAAGTNISVTPVTVGNVKTYTVTNTASAPSPPQILAFHASVNTISSVITDAIANYGTAYSSVVNIVQNTMNINDDAVYVIAGVMSLVLPPIFLAETFIQDFIGCPVRVQFLSYDPTNISFLFVDSFSNAVITYNQLNTIIGSLDSPIEINFNITTHL